MGTKNFLGRCKEGGFEEIKMEEVCVAVLASGGLVLQ